MVLAHRERVQRESHAGLQVEYSVSLRSLFIAFALGVLLTLARGRVLGVARERDDDLGRDPEPSRAAACRAAGGFVLAFARRSQSGALLA